MRTLILSTFAIAAAALLPNPASADEISDRTQAIQLCRAEVSQQAGIEAGQARLDQVRVRPHTVRVDLDVWANGNLRNVRCDVTRGATLQIASISPALTATAATASN